jgi:hypothetical protein
VEAFRAYGTKMPALTELAVSSWFVPAAVGLGIASFLASLVLPVRRSRRLGVAAASVVISASALVFAVFAAFEPIFRPGP